ncbi:hypothetical protein M5689_022542 [Euphorbia peplus]|nr:hypothetical protein M5689_022542 [Euphorbia peplus]
MERRGGGSARNPSMEKKKNKMKRKSEMLAGIDSSRDERIKSYMWSMMRVSFLMAKMEKKKKMKKKKKNKRSRYGALLAQPGEIGGGVGGGSESQRLDKNKKKITGLEEVEKLQDDDRGLAHSGEIGGSSKSYQHKGKRDCGKDFTDEEESPDERFLGGNDSSQDMMIKPWPKLFEEAQFIFQCELAEKALQLYKEREGLVMERRGVGSALTPSMEKRKNKMMKLKSEMLAGIDSSGDETFTPDMLSILLCKEAEFDYFCELAQQALQLYKEREGVEFEVIEPLFLKSAWLHIRGAGFKHMHSFSHMSFTAKPRNGDCNEASSLKYFFTELLKNRDTGKFIVMVSFLMAMMEKKKMKKKKKKKNKKKRSRYGALLAQPGEIGGGVGGGSESQRLDKNKKKITGLDEVEKLQDDDRGLAHSGEIGGSSKRYQHTRKRDCGQDFTDEEESPDERFLGGNDSSQDMMIKPWPKLRGVGYARNPSMEKKKKKKKMKRRSEMLAGIDSSRDMRITYDTWEILL